MVIQGGKLLGLLYTIYTNVVLIIHHKISDKIYKINNKLINYNKKVSHETIHFLDDSSAIISFPDTTIIKEYITDYYNLLETFYNANMLKIIPQKMKLLIVTQNKYRLLLK